MTQCIRVCGKCGVLHPSRFALPKCYDGVVCDFSVAWRDYCDPSFLVVALRDYEGIREE
ncbi:hypothetical protein L195_g042380 [Trifolium pratense]|uniref:Uncharacterized protein n=1 Tax=Trifolium pratense TaxID=57577 RepID=A0A2K3M680_TRIPR|nr:hypothetical protein L195_g042380 [Trifolium pratense]